MSATVWARARLLAGAAVLAALLGRLGAGPFLDGLRTVSVRSLVAALAITAATTVCSAWRWTLVARGLGLDISLRAAVAAYYRSQFLNTALPGGVLGDVHRGVRHGRESGDLGRGLRAVVWERAAGQLVQMALTLAVLLALPSPLRPAMPGVLSAIVVVALAAAVAWRAWPALRLPRRARVLRADLRDGVLAPPILRGVLCASIAVVAGHTATFLLAARTAGSSASPAELLPLAMLVLLAMAVPANLGGWGPREGVAAWSFAAAGLGAGGGVAAATVYGVLVFTAALPGAAVLVVTLIRRGSPTRGAGVPRALESAVHG